jgi:uncharacterized protein
MLEFLSNRILLTAIAANFFAQGLKVIIPLITERKFEPSRLFETGGMPSSHSAGIVALAAGLGITQGWDSPELAVAFTLAAFVIYDAAKVRQAAGQHAELLNGLIQELGHLFREDFRPQALKTLLGHTVPQVIAGTLIGLLATFISYGLF